MGIVPQLNASHLNKWGNVTLGVLHFAVLAIGDLGARGKEYPLLPAPCTESFLFKEQITNNQQHLITFQEYFP
jgi:hypothetical protein